MWEISRIGRNLGRLRRDRGMTQEGLAHAADVSVDVISKLEQGARRGVRISTLAKLADALDADIAELFAQPERSVDGHENPFTESAEPLEEELDEVLDAGGEPVAPAEAEGPRIGQAEQDTSVIPGVSVEASASPYGRDDVKRRALLQLIAAAGAGAAVPPGVVEEVFAGVDRAVGTQVDLADWNMAVREYGSLVSQQPMGTLIDNLAADVIGIGRMLEGELSDSERTGLLRVSAALSSLLAIEFDNVGDRRSARKAWGTARRAADASDNRGLRVWVRAKQADEALWAGLPHDHITALAAEAAQIADGAPCAGLPRVHATLASLAAEAGDSATAQRQMTEFSRVFDRLPDSVSSDPTAFGWNAARQRWEQAYVYTILGDRRAEAALEESMALYPPGTLGPVANLRVIQAMGMVRDREVDDGLSLTLSTLHELPISSARHHMSRQILRKLPGNKARALPAAREVHALTYGQSRTALL
ncbi:helix-turn-helix domain-containing protein [Actinomadura rubrisoli]|uniref:XRE family transcriptional regulator n=1 Tax=Actinomadura rubrisoli TaxID=2530368 RepID=A0A4R5AI42_9ACTN|nr:helix-turn-helix domain-containing protein [Actinomadura rubrisoli]TDD72171.1 XRE family transcriptional regulator [Actinomadura rubrisoli]